MPFDAVFVVCAGLAILLAGLSKGGFGAGAAFVSTPLLAIAVGPVAAVAILLPILIAMDLIGLRAYWRKWDWHVAWPMMAACVPGVGIGWLVFDHLPLGLLSVLMGALTILILGYQLLGNWLLASSSAGDAKSASAKAGLGAWGWGGLAGFMSFVIHAGGPPVAVHLLPRRMDKTLYQATTVLFFAFVNAVKLVPYFALGLFDSANVTKTLWLMPLAPLAMLLGIWAHSKINQALYYGLVYALAFLASMKLIWDGFLSY